jgi:hypothetical protein
LPGPATTLPVPIRKAACCTCQNIRGEETTLQLKPQKMPTPPTLRLRFGRLLLRRSVAIRLLLALTRKGSLLFPLLADSGVSGINASLGNRMILGPSPTDMLAKLSQLCLGLCLVIRHNVQDTNAWAVPKHLVIFMRTAS